MVVAECHNQSKLRFWCQMVLPLVYDDSLSYMELLNKVVNYLNNCIQDVGNCETNIELLLDAFESLQDYVNEMVEDISPEIESVIDQMIENGDFTEILTDALNTVVAPEYDEETSYLQYEYVLYEGNLYRANTTTSGEFDPTKWTEKTIAQDLTVLERYVYGLTANDVPYDGTQTYDAGSTGKAIKDLAAEVDSLDAGDIAYNSSTTYNNATVGKELGDLKGALTTNNLPVNPCIKEAKLIAHQGSTSFVQSSDLCFKNAIMQGFKILEGDVQKTSDNKFVIWHDSTAGGLTVATSTLAQIQALTLDYGCKVLSLEEFLKLAIENSIAVELDLTTTHFSDANFTTYAQTIYNAVKAINPSLDSVIWTINYQKALVLEAIDPTVIICYSGLASAASIGDNVKRLVKNSRLFMFSQNKSSIDSDIVAWSHNNGVLIKAYTITTEAELFTAFASGADCAIVESILPHIDEYLYIADPTIMANWIYDGRISLSVDQFSCSVRVSNNNVVLLSIHGIIEKTLSASQRSIMTLPTFLRPGGAYVGTCVWGDSATSLNNAMLCNVAPSGYVNIYHNGAVAIGKHFGMTLCYFVPSFISTFPALS